MNALVEQIKSSAYLRWNNVRRIRPKVRICFDAGTYTIKTAETSAELVESFKLRHEVFHREFRGVDDDGFDIDKFDRHFDHLIVICKISNKVVGVYRLSCSTYSQESYAGLEFDVSNIKGQSRVTIELGRACIHRDHRKALVIRHLWRGIREYMDQCQADILFGCSSLKINNVREAALVYKHLVDLGHVSDVYTCKPTEAYRMRDFDTWYAYWGERLDPQQELEAKNLVPSLISSYLKLGAKIACEPAFDEDFDCIDMLTVLSRKDLSNSLADRFKVAR